MTFKQQALLRTFGTVMIYVGSSAAIIYWPLFIHSIIDIWVMSTSLYFVTQFFTACGVFLIMLGACTVLALIDIAYQGHLRRIKEERARHK